MQLCDCSPSDPLLPSSKSAFNSDINSPIYSGVICTFCITVLIMMGTKPHPKSFISVLLSTDLGSAGPCPSQPDGSAQCPIPNLTSGSSASKREGGGFPALFKSAFCWQVPCLCPGYRGQAWLLCTAVILGCTVNFADFNLLTLFAHHPVPKHYLNVSSSVLSLPQSITMILVNTHKPASLAPDTLSSPSRDD